MKTLNYNAIIEIIFKKISLYIEWWDPCINNEVLCDKKFKEM